MAAYLIFGSWLNYSRHGARGWDLLPHGDAIRDLPYLMKDWARRVVSTVQGGGGRGYSAVRSRRLETIVFHTTMDRTNLKQI